MNNKYEEYLSQSSVHNDLTNHDDDHDDYSDYYDHSDDGIRIDEWHNMDEHDDTY